MARIVHAYPGNGRFTLTGTENGNSISVNLNTSFISRILRMAFQKIHRHDQDAIYYSINNEEKSYGTDAWTD